MRTTSHSIPSLVQLIGTGLMLVSLIGCLALPAGSGSGLEPTAFWEYQNDRGYREYQHDREYRGYRHDQGDQEYRSYQRPGYALPDRYTIHQGQKCEIQCERVWGTRDYQCREYRC